MTAKIDIKNNSRISFGKNGYRAERVALVSGITGTAAQFLFNAINDLALPNYGDVHPEIAGLYLNNLTCEPLSGGRARVVMSYFNEPSALTGSSNATVTAQTASVTEEVTEDINGNRLEARFQGDYLPDPGLSYTTWWIAEVETPRISFDFEYTAAVFPSTEINTYLNNTNSVIWNGYAVDTILCSAINATQRGDNYVIRFTFAHNPDTWLFKGAVKGPNLPLSAHPTNPDLSINLTTGVKSFPVYASVDFTPLGFTL